MAAPVIFSSMNEWTWVKVATAKVAGFIHKLNSQVYYYQTYRPTGVAAPSVPTTGTIPAEAVRMFDLSNTEMISSSEQIDVYVMPANSDDDAADDVGKVRVDL